MASGSWESSSGNGSWSYNESSKVLTLSGSGTTYEDYGDNSGWKQYRGEATSIVINSGFTRIGDFAFQYFAKVTSLSLPSSLKEIGAGAFQEMYMLKEVTIPSSVVLIETNAFHSMGYETKSSFPLSLSSVTEIGIDAFFRANVSSVSLGTGVKKIGKHAFQACSSLTTVSISKNVSEIGAGAFTYCTALTSLTIDADNSYYKTDGNAIYNKNGDVLVECLHTKAQGYTIPSTVTRIGVYAFESCTISQIDIPSSVTIIDDYAFRSTGLTSITIPKSVSTIGYAAYQNCKSLSVITFEGTKPTIENYSFSLSSSSSQPVTATVYTKGWGSDAVFTSSIRGSYTTFVYVNTSPPIPVKRSGEWTPAIAPVKVSDEWRDIKSVYAKVAGVWRTIVGSVNKMVILDANGASGTYSAFGTGAYTVPSNTFSRSGYKFSHWNTKSDGTGTSYNPGAVVTLSTSLTLYAIWIKTYTVVYRATNKSDWHGDSDTGPMEYYALWIDGVEQSDLGAFSGAYRTYTDLPHGTTIKVYVGDKYGKEKSYVHVNGTAVTGSGNSIEYTMTLTSNLDINMEWNTDGLAFYNPGSWWRCFITTS